MAKYQGAKCNMQKKCYDRIKSKVEIERRGNLLRPFLQSHDSSFR